MNKIVKIIIDLILLILGIILVHIAVENIKQGVNVMYGIYQFVCIIFGVYMGVPFVSRLNNWYNNL